jgi:hypothetical protein
MGGGHWRLWLALRHAARACGTRLVNDVLVRFDLIDFQRRLHGLGGRRGRESTVPVCVFGCLNAVRQCSSPSPADCVACGCRLGIRHGMGCLPCATLDHIRVSISSLTTLPSIVMKCRVGCCMCCCCGGENAFQGTSSCLASPTNGGNRWLLTDQLRASVLDRCCVSSRLQETTPSASIDRPACARVVPAS